jgi:putative Mn2+ efflux pump MntP
MPGSPYFDERPKGLLTWPKLLKIGLPISLLAFSTGYYFDVLLEVMLTATLLLGVTAVIRR